MHLHEGTKPLKIPAQELHGREVVREFLVQEQQQAPTNTTEAGEGVPGLSGGAACLLVYLFFFPEKGE